MKKIHFALIAIIFGISGTTSAYAHDSVDFSLNIGAPAYHSAPPVYYAPPPVYYTRPPVYVRAAPVYYEPYGVQAYYGYDDRRFRHDHRGWGKHRGHDDDD